MIPTYRYSISSPMPLDLNEDHHSYQHLFNTTNQASSSSSSISYSTLFNPDQDQAGSSSSYLESNHTQSNEKVGKFIPCKGSWDHEEVENDGSIRDLKVKDLKKEDGNGNFEAEDISMKCMPLKMRIKLRMMVDQTCSENKVEKQKLPLSPLGTTNSISSNNSSNHSNITVRVCTDCHTTKTPLWRSGPTGPKSLCNACGIRQRKAKRALAAAAAESGNDTTLVKENKLQSKGKRSKTKCTPAPLKKKFKHGGKGSRRRNNFKFDDLIVRLSENLGPQQVFPQDEKEAAILLMALSHGLLHGFPQIVT